jgi:glycerophosphoryl diester phosphodiesterase
MRLLTIAALLFLFTNGTYKPNPVPVSKHQFIVISHRGDHVIYPENTIEAYKEAIKNEADYIEIDLRTTRDSQLVSMHDATVNRVTTAKGLVADFTINDLLSLKIESNDTASAQTYSIPTFAAILKLCKNKMNIYLDFKAADAAAAYKMIKKYGMEKQVLVYINSYAQLAGWRKVAPHMPLMLSLPNNIKDIEGMKYFVEKNQPDLLDGDWKQYTPEMVKYAQEVGLPVWPDIQSAGEAADWGNALQKGFKGLQTDHPAALIAFLKVNKLR